jgi:hypothetical protein
MSSSINAPADEEPEEYDASPPTKGRPSKIHDCNQKLYRVFSKDGLRETAYHVTDRWILPRLAYCRILNGPNRSNKRQANDIIHQVCDGSLQQDALC